MRPTLFYIPHEWLGIPVLGFGWALGLLVIVAVVTLLTARQRQTIGQVLEEQGVLWLVGAAIIIFLLPRIEARIDDGTPEGWIVGLPVRGYGVMLMLGVLSAVGLALHRGFQAGIEREAFFSLATWVVVCGLLGARIFYVVQKWSELSGTTVFEKLWTALKVTEGGLVVYGSVIGGLVAILLWSYRNKQPLLIVADVVTPAFFVGLAFGRVGCLLNGCCYGGICEAPLPSITFPAGSPAYMDQLSSGQLLGMQTTPESKDSRTLSIDSVVESSWADKQGIKPGEHLNDIRESTVDGPTPQKPLAHPVFQAEVQVDSKQYHVSSDEIPSRSAPVHPSQLYAAVSGMLLAWWTCMLGDVTRRSGIVFGASLISYGVLRIIEEIIRVDEAGQFGTALSIAQWISILGIVAGIVVLATAKLRPIQFAKPAQQP